MKLISTYYPKTGEIKRQIVDEPVEIDYKSLASILGREFIQLRVSREEVNKLSDENEKLLPHQGAVDKLLEQLKKEGTADEGISSLVQDRLGEKRDSDQG